MKLRLYHHPDGARVAYREQGTGQPMILWHSELLSHRELVPLVEELEHRYRVILPDLPLHGDSEDRPSHPYTRRWLAEVVAGFCRDVGGAHPITGGHGLGAEIVLEAIAAGLLVPSKLVLMGNRLHRPGSREADWNAWLVAARAGAVPGADRVLMRAARIALRPQRGVQLSARSNPEAADVIRHALADVAGNANLARSWAAFARGRPTAPRRELLDAYGAMEFPVLLLWADEDPRHPIVGAEEALDLLPDGELRVVPRTGYLMAWDDPVAVAREISAFCG